MPRTIKSLKDYAPHFNDAPTYKLQSDRTDRMLLGMVALSAAVAIGGFVFAVVRFFD